MTQRLNAEHRFDRGIFARIVWITIYIEYLAVNGIYLL